MLRQKLLTDLNNANLILLDIAQKLHKGKKSTKVTVVGYSESNKKYQIKEYLIMSINENTISKVIINNWH